VEIAYFTFPEHERQGVATAAARELVQIARRKIPGIRRHCPSATRHAILVKLGFVLKGEAVDDDVGRVWEWQLETGGGRE
jgi:ribosomal-protein-alanine N-acetyltransferase